MLKQLPNYFTLLNLLLGCLAIVFTLQTGNQIASLNGENLLLQLPESMTWATLCILAAGAVDFLDGFVARLLNAASEMGKQLDSLCDVVTFGVAPSMMLYQLLRMSYMREPDALDTSFALLLPAFLPALAAAWRLARFNIDERQAFHFHGAPTPITAFVVAALPMVLWHNQWNMAQWILNKWVLYALALVLSYLMVSNLPLMALKLKKRSLAGNKPQLVLVVLALVLLLVLGWLAIPFIYVSYVVLSLLFRKHIS
jgi:CDP-diacylglycerol--serine O-phosphatidyltransferase